MHSIHTLLDSHDGYGLGELVRKGEVQPGELLEAVIERIERVEPQLNAVCEKLYDRARAEAQSPTAHQGAFAGVPTLIKDLFSPLRGALMTNGSLACGEVRADFEAEVVARLRQAGCVFAGSSTAPEFGTSYTTESTRFGATRWFQWRCGGPDGGAGGALCPWQRWRWVAAGTGVLLWGVRLQTEPRADALRAAGRRGLGRHGHAACDHPLGAR